MDSLIVFESMGYVTGFDTSFENNVHLTHHVRFNTIRKSSGPNSPAQMVRTRRDRSLATGDCWNHRTPDHPGPLPPARDHLLHVVAGIDYGNFCSRVDAVSPSKKSICEQSHAADHVVFCGVDRHDDVLRPSSATTVGRNGSSHVLECLSRLLWLGLDCQVDQ